MVTIDDGNIIVTQGDSLAVPIMPYTDESHKEVYRLAEGEMFRFCVREVAGGDPIIEDWIEVQAEDGSFTITLTAEQTSMLIRTEYVFDVALVNGDGTTQDTFYGGEETKKVLRVV